MCLAISSSKEEGSLNYTILGNETAYHAMPAALDEAGAQEELYLGNDDDWLYGLHAMKPERGSA